MSEKKKNRKSSRHFNLEKPVERHFEIEKDADVQEVAPIKPEGNKPQLSIPTTPEKKQEDIEKPSATPTAGIKNPSVAPKIEDKKKPEETAPISPKIDESDNISSDDGKSSKWKWLIPAAIVVAAVPSYFLFTGNDDASSNKDQIVMNSPNNGQDNVNEDSASPNAAADDNSNLGNVDNSAGSDNVGDSGNTENAVNSDNIDTGSSSSGIGSVGNSPSGVKGSTQPSEGQSSSNNYKQNSGTSASSTTSTNSDNNKVGSTGLSSGQGKSAPNGSKDVGTNDSPIIPGSIEQKALDVIRGVFGNGQVRKDKLGAEYAEIQKLVNEMYRNGTIKR